MEVKIRPAGVRAVELDMRVERTTMVKEVKESLLGEMKLDSISKLFLVHNGKIADDGCTVGEIGVKEGDTIFAVLQDQAPTWKLEKSEEPLPSQARIPVSSLSAKEDDDPILIRIKELENSIFHLQRSNAELQAAGPDPVYEEAIQENIVAIAKKKAEKEELKKLREEEALSKGQQHKLDSTSGQGREEGGGLYL